jgi:CheY-like chemotaxis protein
VLAVDDEEVNLTVVRAALEPVGYEVWGTTSANIARALVRVRRPDIALLDVMMPGASGIELCEDLRKNPATADLPIVLVTALGADRTRSRALKCGADDYLEKPVEIDDLIDRVASWVARGRQSVLGAPAGESGDGVSRTPGSDAVRAAAAEVAGVSAPQLLRAMARAAGIDESDVDGDTAGTDEPA